MGIFRGQPLPETIEIETAVGPAFVSVNAKTNARRLTLRVSGKTGQPVVTLPPSIGLEKLTAFLERNADWLARQIAKFPKAREVKTGATIPFRGAETELLLTGRPPRTVFHCDNQIVIGGPKDLAANRLQAFLRDQARKTIREAALRYAHMLGKQPKSISIRDTVTRWGSCSSRGTLNFSWRLIMAPPAVLDYVAAHEVAHLQEMNHSPRFWAIVTDLYGEWGDARGWLQKNGERLLAVRFDVSMPEDGS